ncbi:peptidoglycan DD-metalloendopeptidase family protein [Lysobacter niastensis]|uniref:Peptidoglycan DD-metalloendopeptidase family protein n=1 Tax=Lysobacter niastensis TaxID=380629 RepID=A0ABS0B9Q5_9GAMM|nr:peptidoglycan DD-metalloendopeptidase family protein [Lysobacter niastensis]
MTVRTRGAGYAAYVAAALAAMAAVAALTGCSSRVIREPGASANAVRPSQPKPGATTVVKRGDTLYRIAFSNGINARDLAAWNGIAEPYTIQPGQRLKLYPPSAATTAPASRPANPPRSTAATSKPGATKPVAPKPKPAAPAPPPVPASSGFGWRWPADGDLIGRYVAGDPTKQGVDIAGNGGAAVRAAADGVVVYSGSGLVGYGELVIIKHSEQWLSAYGHNRSRLVNEGQLVKAGEQIAEMGRSGAARDMLHFEVRYNGKPVDPLLYLPKR